MTANASHAIDLTQDVKLKCDSINPNNSQAATTYCEYHVDTRMRPPHSQGCDLELQVLFYCPSNPWGSILGAKPQIKYYTVFGWEMDTVIKTIECDSPFVYSRKSQYILEVEAESRKGSFSLRYPQQLNYFGYLSDYYEDLSLIHISEPTRPY